MPFYEIKSPTSGPNFDDIGNPIDCHYEEDAKLRERYKNMSHDELVELAMRNEEYIGKKLRPSATILGIVRDCNRNVYNDAVKRWAEGQDLITKTKEFIAKAKEYIEKE